MVVLRRVASTALAIVLLSCSASIAFAQKAGQVQPMCQTGCFGTYGVVVTPDGSTKATPPNVTGQTALFNVHNTSSQSTLTFTLTCSATGGISCTNVSPSSLTLTAGGDADATITYSVGSSGGLVTLTAYNGNASDTGYYNVAFGGEAAELANYNGDNHDRSACLTSGAGHSAAYQCGDLMVAHSMPGYATMGKERAPTLIYTSAQAYPTPMVHAKVTLGGAFAPPNSVYGELFVCHADGTSCTSRRTGTWNGWGAFGAAQAREVGFVYASTEATGAYPFQLLIRSQYTGFNKDTTIYGKLLIVNRAASKLGQGWSLAGVEWIQLQPDSSMLWVGGDGSAKLYAKVNDTLWRAPAGGFRDSLAYHAGATTYTRKLRHGVIVTFDAGGRHTLTTNRVGQVTRFWWTVSPERLDSLSVPPGGSGTVYRLAYDANGHLDKITDPKGRILDAAVTTGGWLGTLTDPDSYNTYFDYFSTGQMAGELPRRTAWSGVGWTTYLYALGVHPTQVNVALDSLGSSLATTYFQAWDEKDIVTNGSSGNTALVPDSVYTKILGPRSGVADDATFWVNGFGAPVKTMDALGSITTVDYDATYPALASRVIYPNTRVTTMRYTTNGHANLTEVRDSTSHIAGAGLPTHSTSYTYGNSSFPDSPTAIADALGRSTTYSYDSLGLTSLVTDPRGHQTKIVNHTLTSDPYKGLVDSIIEKSVPTWQEVASPPNDTSDTVMDLPTTFVYDTKGNVTQVKAPTKLVTAYVRDTLERVTDVYDLLGTRISRAYNAANQLTSTTQYMTAQTLPYSLALTSGVTCDPLQVVCSDSTKPNVNSLSSTLLTQYAYGRSGLTSITDPRSVVRSYGYDYADEPTKETDDYGLNKQQTYDGGLLATTVSRRGETVRYHYDAAGRLTSLAYPQRVYTGDTLFTIPSDSIRYAYDAMGNQTSAVSTAHTTTTIRRTFYADGSLHAQWFNKDFTDSLEYTYDASGARTTMKHVIITGATTRTDSLTYSYNATTGDLDSLTVRWGSPVSATRTFKFVWDALGRRRLITYPNGTTVKTRYDASGRLRRLVALHPNGTNDVLDLTFRNRAVDPAGRILWQELACGTYNVAGSACGANMVSTWNGYERRGMLVRQVTGAVVDSSRYDASGNLIQRRPQAGIPYTSYSVATSHNELTLMVDSGSTHRLRFTYDSNGARTYELDSTSLYRTRGYYYDGLGRTTGTRGYLGQDLYNNTEACQYGPDGQMNVPCENGAPTLAMDGANTVAAYNGSGVASFVHATGLDDPLIGLVRSLSGGSTRELYFITDGAGREFAVGDSTGAFDTGLDQSLQWMSWRYSGGSKSSNTFASSRLAAPTVPGLSFFRNRVYDQNTGRWTQEDPIGVAGGLNLYQFNGNNPVSYTDPFGLDTVRVQGEGSEAAVAYMKSVSSTFARDFAALDADPSVNLLIRDPANRAEAEATYGMQFSRPRDGSKRGTILFNVVGMNNVNRDLGPGAKWIHTAGSDLAHELGHAAAAFGHGSKACAADPRPGGTGCIIHYENTVRKEMGAGGGAPRTEY